MRMFVPMIVALALFGCRSTGSGSQLAADETVAVERHTNVYAVEAKDGGYVNALFTIGRAGETCKTACAAIGRAFDPERANMDTEACKRMLKDARLIVETAGAHPDNGGWSGCFMETDSFLGFASRGDWETGDKSLPTARRACACKS